VEAPTGRGGARKPVVYFCEACEVKCPDAPALAKHLQGRRHRSHMASLAEEEEERKASLAGDGCGPQPTPTKKAFPWSLPQTPDAGQGHTPRMPSKCLLEIMEEEDRQSQARQRSTSTPAKPAEKPRGVSLAAQPPLATVWVPLGGVSEGAGPSTSPATPSPLSLADFIKPRSLPAAGVSPGPQSGSGSWAKSAWGGRKQSFPESSPGAVE
jgi:hypothetical protein